MSRLPGSPEPLPVEDLAVGDWPVGLAGFRPATEVKHHPRLKKVVFVAGGVRYEREYGTTLTVRRKAS